MAPPLFSSPRRTRAALVFCVASVLLCLNVAPSRAADWKPAQGPLATRWAKQVSPERVHPEYPRPQLVRERWTNLNGLWGYAIRPRGEGRPAELDGHILVPFAVESALSGVMKKVGPENRLWYRRTFEAPSLAEGERLLLHFGAVDWHAVVSVNGQKVGEHRGGYDPFTFDITSALKPGGEQELVVAVWDPTDAGYQPRGKQVREPRGIWYTSVTGIWQTVWLEPVPARHIRSLKLTPDVERKQLRITVDAANAGEQTAFRAVSGELVSKNTSNPHELVLDVPEPKLWSPDSPHLYDLTVTMTHAGKRVDEVRSYFGMRSIALGTDEDGHRRLFLNGEPLFHFGPLDQGWWPDGLYTAPTDEALAYDVEVTRKLGMNTARKHVKVEPARWYYHCDRLGLLVWQDMPNGDRHIRRDQPDIERSKESEENFWREYQALIDSFRNHPSIVVWVPFNEGWGQFKTNEVLAWTKEYDPTRLVDGPSGWTDRGTGDMHDIHSYPGPAMPQPEKVRAIVLGEFGGLGLPLEKHLWWNKRNWGYRTYRTSEELRSNYDTLMRKLRPMIGRGLAAAIYTQTTDVEGEVNGLMTYDRAVIKFEPKHVAAIHARFYEPQPIIETRVVVPTSQQKGRVWRYTTDEPLEGWHLADFDDSGWKRGEGGFGEPTTPGSVVRTEWKTGDIWLRRVVELDGTKLVNPHLLIHHDEDAEIFIDGVQAARVSGYVTDYVEVEIEPAAREALRKDRRAVIAVHCHQTGGGQYIDVGIVDVIERPRPEGGRPSR